MNYGIMKTKKNNRVKLIHSSILCTKCIMFSVFPSYTTHYNNEQLAFPVHPLIHTAQRCGMQRYGNQIYKENQDEIFGNTHQDRYAQLDDLGVPTLLVRCSSKTNKCVIYRDDDDIETISDEKFEELFSSLLQKPRHRKTHAKRASPKKTTTKKHRK